LSEFIVTPGVLGRTIDWLMSSRENSRKPDIISISFGTRPGDEATAVQRRLIRAIQARILIVSSIGNDGDGPGLCRSPANLPVAQVIGVGATRQDGMRASFSNYGNCNGESQPNISAPGVNIPVANAAGGYRVCWGTSASAAIVSGIAARLVEGGYAAGSGEALRASLVRTLGEHADNTNACNKCGTGVARAPGS
jgi:Subtilase family